MADADWHLYRQLRGQDLPETFEYQGVGYRRQKLLKRDFYAAVGLYDAAAGSEPRQVLLKVYHTDPFWGVPLRWLGRWLCRRETHFYHHLAGIDGVPRFLGGHGEAGIIREYVPGCNLREYRQRARPDRRFYPELLRILGEVHARGMSHNDLAKPENVLVRDDGRPVLIDFQIALGPNLPGGWLLRGPMCRFLGYMQSVDRYHLMKHYTYDRPEDLTPQERKAALDKGVVLKLHALFVRRPYRAVRHAVLLRWLRVEEGGKKAA